MKILKASKPSHSFKRKTGVHLDEVQISGYVLTATMDTISPKRKLYA